VLYRVIFDGLSAELVGEGHLSRVGARARVRRRLSWGGGGPGGALFDLGRMSIRERDWGTTWQPPGRLRWQNLATVVLPYMFACRMAAFSPSAQQWESYLLVGILR